jgi:hypothetical protein
MENKKSLTKKVTSDVVLRHKGIVSLKVVGIKKVSRITTWQYDLLSTNI